MIRTLTAAVALLAFTGCLRNGVTSEQLAEIFADRQDQVGRCNMQIETITQTGDNGSTNIIVIDGVCELPTGDEDRDALGFACGNRGESAIVCTWNAGTLTLATTSGVDRATRLCSSPCEIDPEISAPAPRQWDMTLEDGAGTVLAGPLPVTTET